MKIVAAKNMPFVAEAFGTLGDVTLLDGRSISAADVRDADLLVTRSTTPITPGLLDGSRVRFYGTATIGTDHIDIPYIEEQGLTWYSAAGCNANSVSEYLTAALLCVAQKHGLTLAGRTIGVVGVGNVGTRVVEKADALGMTVIPNDPPRERRGDRAPEGKRRPEAGRGRGWASLPELLAESDVVTLHTPLTQEGEDATVHLADEGFFAQLKPGCIFINAARGPIVDTDALLRAMECGIVAHAIIDTWEGEPDFRTDLMERAAIVSPHIAGYSYEGKYMGTVMVYREACRFLGVEPSWTPDALLPPPGVPELTAHADLPAETALWDLVRRVYDIEADDARMRALRSGDEAERRHHFDGLRKSYPIRREFRFTEVHADDTLPSVRNAIEGFGFTMKA
ncbi:MAG: 4-phosphoerythronate dehydrogenase [Kiritimatiellia bacterium]|jgi:erythronate-4-phosphate dehydrogenase|nr:4-phosphoerythronate dehydrogenase [Kiritimatiellia bacterium]MDP6811067.1 4-phosphoerythronate dehydrogenase [Kiritimatiellia bacterium]MDP7023078.1 4-phosphoerythronate dehydrogenase [Kiritimatiellia bacterium]